MCGCCRSMYSIRYIRCVLMVVKSYQFFHDIQLHLPPDYPSNWEHKKYGTYHQINQYLVGSHTRKVWNLCSAAGSFHCPGKHGSESRSRQRMLVVWQHDTNIPPPILDSLLHQTLYKQVLPWTSMSVSLFLCSVFLQQQSVVYSILILVPLVTSMAVDLMKSPFLSVFRWCQGHRYAPSQDLMAICIFLTLICLLLDSLSCTFSPQSIKQRFIGLSFVLQIALTTGNVRQARDAIRTRESASMVRFIMNFFAK